MPPRRTVYRIATATDWAAARRRGVDAGSAPRRRDGFIHMSRRDRPDATFARSFAGAADVVLPAAECGALSDRPRWDDVPGHGDFPHDYGAFDIVRREDLGPLALGDDGTHVLPPAVVSP